MVSLGGHKFELHSTVYEHMYMHICTYAYVCVFLGCRRIYPWIAHYSLLFFFFVIFDEDTPKQCPEVFPGDLEPTRPAFQCEGLRLGSFSDPIVLVIILQYGGFQGRLGDA